MRALEWTSARGSMNFDHGPRVMAIVNVTPDSFSDGGQFFAPDRALQHCLQLIEDGADILDIGGESTRPGSSLVSPEEEIQRVVPLIQSLRETQDIPISVDTTKAAVADATLRAGADIINDISGMRFDERMPEVIASHNAAVVLMHVPASAERMHEPHHYDNIADEVWSYLRAQVRVAIDAGIDKERIAIDPGFGFGKDVSQNLALIQQLPFFVAKGYPLLVGISRKRTIRAHTASDTESLDHGSSVAHAFAAAHGAHLLRVHNVRAAKAAIGMGAAIYLRPTQRMQK